MNRWIGKVAVVTGAGTGIGSAIAIDLIKAGMIVVGLGRRVERIEALQSQIPDDLPGVGKLYAKKCDVSKEDEVKSVFKWIEDNVGGCDVLVNNAGVLTPMNTLDNDNSDALRSTVETNFLGTIWCVKEAFNSMKNRNVTTGHIILMNSQFGHRVMYFAEKYPSFNVYPSTKYGITAMTEVLRQELLVMGTKIKITSISPGFVKTEIFSPEFLAAIENIPHLLPEDVSNTVLYVLGTPPHVQIHELQIKAIGEQF